MIATRHGSSGFTLVEVLIAIGLFVVIALGVAQLSATATRAARTARERTMAVVLAAGKLDELRALDWSYEPAIAGDPPRPRTDLATNLSRGDYARDGPGLAPSPANTLATSTPPYVDYTDDRGQWAGSGSVAPRNAVFVRRWSVEPAADAPDRLLVLRVLVTTVAADRSRSGAGVIRGVDVVMTTMRTRARGGW